MASPTATADTIKAGALRELGVLASGETASAADDDLAESKLDQLIDDMVADHACNFSKDRIPDDAILGLTYMLAYRLTGDFDAPDEMLVKISTEHHRAKRNFRSRRASVSAETTPFVNF